MSLTPLMLRCDPATAAKIKSAAKADGRSISNWLLCAAKAALLRRKLAPLREAKLP